METEAMTYAAEARVPTELPRRYLAQLCKHFQHKLPVTLEETRGHIAFPSGDCDVTAEAGTLVLRVAAREEGALPVLQDVVARHLERFAFREKPEIRWQRIE